MRPPSLNKARNTKDAISADPKKDFRPHATNTHTHTHTPPPPTTTTTIKILQTTKITNLGFLSLTPPQLVFNRRFAISELKSKYINTYCPLPEINHRWLELSSELSTIRPLTHVHLRYLKISNSWSGTLLKLHFLEAMQHNSVLKFHTHSLKNHQLPIELKPYHAWKRRQQNHYSLNYVKTS